MSAVDLVVPLFWASVLAILVSIVLIAAIAVGSALDAWQLKRWRRKPHETRDSRHQQRQSRPVARLGWGHPAGSKGLNSEPTHEAPTND